MKCDWAQTQLLDYLYGELNEADNSNFQAHLMKCAECQTELVTLRQTRRVLAALPQESPAERIVFTPAPGRRSFVAWWHDVMSLLPQPLWARLSLAAAAALAVLLVAGSLANLEISHRDGQFAVRMGILPAPATELSPEAREALLSQIREEQANLTAQMIAQSELRQIREWDQAFTSFAQQMERKQQTELRLIGTSIDQLYRSNQTRWDEQSRVLQEFARQVNFPKR